MAQTYEDLLADGPDYNKDIDTWNDTFGGTGLVTFGLGTKNKAIDQYLNKIRGRQGEIAGEIKNVGDQTYHDNRADWDNLMLDVFGTDGNKLDNQYADFQGQDQAALQDLMSGLDDYKSMEDLAADPSFMADVGDVDENVDVDLSGMQDAAGEFKKRSLTGETAESKLMREMAKRQMEANLRGDREAIARNLKARGAYGSNEELLQTMMAQQEGAQRRSLENMQASKAAEDRSDAMLGKYGDMASKLSDTQLKADALRKQTAMFNNSINQQGANARANLLYQGRGMDNTAGRDAAKTKFGAQRGVTDRMRGDEGTVRGAKAGLTGASTASRTSDANMKIGGLEKEDANLDQLGADWASRKEDKGVLGIF